MSSDFCDSGQVHPTQQIAAGAKHRLYSAAQTAGGLVESFAVPSGVL